MVTRVAFGMVCGMASDSVAYGYVGRVQGRGAQNGGHRLLGGVVVVVVHGSEGHGNVEDAVLGEFAVGPGSQVALVVGDDAGVVGRGHRERDGAQKGFGVFVRTLRTPAVDD